MEILLFLLSIAAIAWAIQLNTRLRAATETLKDLTARYQPAMDIDRHVLNGEKQVRALLEERQQINAEIASAKTGLMRLNEELALASDAAFLVEIGYYEPRYEFEDIPSYEAELTRIRDKQKTMLREDGTGSNKGGAATYHQEQMRRNQLTITYPEGDAQQLHQALLLLKRSRCLNISAFCREAIAEMLERLEAVK